MNYAYFHLNRTDGRIRMPDSNGNASLLKLMITPITDH